MQQPTEARLDPGEGQGQVRLDPGQFVTAPQFCPSLRLVYSLFMDQKIKWKSHPANVLIHLFQLWFKSELESSDKLHTM